MDLAFSDDRALGHGQVAVRHAHHQAHVLLDQQERGSLVGHLVEDIGQLVHDHRGQAFGGLIKQDQAGVGHERAAHRQHLLLPPREGRARRVRTLLQNREQLVDLLHRPGALAAHGCAQQQVLFHRQVGHNAPALRHHHHAVLCGEVGPGLGQIGAAQLDVPVFELRQTQNGVDHRRLAHAVAPDQGHTLARVHMQVQAVQDVGRAVVGVYVLQIQQGRHAALPR